MDTDEEKRDIKACINFRFNITKITVLLMKNVADNIIISTSLPGPILCDDQCLELSFSATYDTGIKYVRKHFEIEPEVIDTRITKPVTVYDQGGASDW